MTARDRLTLPDRSPTPSRDPGPDLPTEIIPAATGPTAPTTALVAADDSADSADSADRDDSEGKFSLSITQIVASTAAAVTAALIGSKLGVAGTLVGAALASIVSGVGAAIYSHSLLVTRRQMKRALQLVRPADEATVAAGPTAAVLGRNRATGPTSAPVMDDNLTVVIPAVIPPIVSRRRVRGRRRTLTAALAGMAAAGVIFAGAVATVTLVETVKGAPLSGGDSGLSVLGGNGSSGTSTDPTTVTVTSPASSSQAPSTTVTQTVTQSPTASSPSSDPVTAPTSAASSPATASASVSASVSERSAAGQATTTAAPTAP